MDDYTVTVMDLNGCEVNNTVFITENFTIQTTNSTYGEYQIMTCEYAEDGWINVWNY